MDPNFKTVYSTSVKLNKVDVSEMTEERLGQLKGEHIMAQVAFKIASDKFKEIRTEYQRQADDDTQATTF